MRVWVASLLFYSFVFAVCELLRFVIVRLVPKRRRLTTQLLLEFVGTLQICTPMFDVGTILEAYGMTGIFIEITLIELANCYWQRDAVAHPCPILTTCYRRGKWLRRAIYVFVAQMAAAYLSFRLARVFWRFGVHPRHLELLAGETCVADLTVALTTGALIEGAAVFIAKAVEKTVSAQYSDFWTPALLNSSFSGVLCTLGINYTGMYANPVVAWACTFNCDGVSHLGHLAVYWASPLIAWYLAEAVFGEEEAGECVADEIAEINATDGKKTDAVTPDDPQSKEDEEKEKKEKAEEKRAKEEKEKREEQEEKERKEKEERENKETEEKERKEKEDREKKEKEEKELKEREERAKKEQDEKERREKEDRERKEQEEQEKEEEPETHVEIPVIFDDAPPQSRLRTPSPASRFTLSMPARSVTDHVEDEEEEEEEVDDPEFEDDEE